MKENKWLIVGFIWSFIVVVLFFASVRMERKAEAEKAAIEQQKEKVQTYDYILPLTPQRCAGVEGNVDIVLITDANYMDFTRVAIQSAKETKCKDVRYHFYVMTLDVSEADKKALLDMSSYKAEVSVLEQKEVDLFYVRDTHVSKTSLLKYYIPTVLADLDKVLYIDSDVMVLHDLTKLFNTPLDGKYLAAVKDPSWFFENMHVLDLGLEDRGFYFNSGVMLLNLKKFREDNLISKLEDYTNNNFRTYMDQDALNVVVGNDVVLLPFKSNAMNFFFEHIDLAKLAEFYGENWKNYQDVFSGATIVHFASSKKPLGPRVPETEFFRMLQETWYKYYSPLPALQ